MVFAGRLRSLAAAAEFKSALCGAWHVYFFQIELMIWMSGSLMCVIPIVVANVIIIKCGRATKNSEFCMRCVLERYNDTLESEFFVL